MAIQRKFITGAILSGVELGPRQILVRASSGAKDRVGDVLVPKGCIIRSATIPVILDHEATVASIVARAQITVRDSSVDALITFMDEGMSAAADDACAKYKGGWATDVSVGFNPLEADTTRDGYVFKSWEILELSLVVLGCNPEAVVTAKDFHASKMTAPLKVKGLYQVGCLARLLSELGCIQDGAQWEADIEQDGSKVPAMLGQVMIDLGNALIAMTKEEVAELLADLKEPGEVAEEAPDADNVDYVTAGATVAVRKFRAGYAKAGRVLSARNEQDLTQARDLINGVVQQVSGDAEEKSRDARIRRAKAMALAVA